MAWFSPSTHEKFHRFRRMKRAWWSFILLMMIFGVSLVSEFWASSTPFVVKWDGQWYFPRFTVIEQDLFYGDGVKTEVDYHDLADSDLFAEDSGNWMVWSPVPYGPDDTLRPEKIKIDERLALSRRRLQRVSSVRVRSDYAMRGGSGFEWFFDENDELPASVKQALEKRFANQASPDFRFENPDGRFEWSLSEFSPRSRAPKTVRIILRETLSTSGEQTPFWIGQGEVRYPDWWADVPDEVKERADQALVDAQTIPVQPIDFVDAEGLGWEMVISKETVQFPFRPVENHPLGLDKSGRDVLVLILYATRISLLFGFILVFFSMLIGTVLGGLQGYFGGWVDLVSQRIIEIYSSIPFLYAMIYLGSVFGTSFGLLLFVYAIFNWIGISYYMRAEFLKLRKQPFTEAARSLGLPTGRIMWKHILPNSLIPLITFFPFSLVGAIGSLSALDFLGFGLPVGTPSWGGLLSQAQEYRFAWWLILYPALALFIVILLGVFIGEGLRTAFDPKRETHWEA